MDEIKDYLTEAFDLYRKDPPDTDFQKGYLAALLEVASEIGLEPYPEDLLGFTKH